MDGRSHPARRSTPAEIVERRRQVKAMIEDGRSRKEITEKLGISNGTFDTDRAALGHPSAKAPSVEPPTAAGPLYRRSQLVKAAQMIVTGATEARFLTMFEADLHEARTAGDQAWVDQAMATLQEARRALDEALDLGRKHTKPRLISGG